MGTEVLRPQQDFLIHRINVNPCRSRRYNYNFTPTYLSNPRANRKPTPKPDHKKPSVFRKPSDDFKTAQNVVVEKVTILRRGESLDSTIKSSETVKKCDVYAGSAFAVSPAPESLPMPSLWTKRNVSVDDSASRDLRRLLRLDF